MDILVLVTEGKDDCVEMIRVLIAPTMDSAKRIIKKVNEDMGNRNWRKATVVEPGEGVSLYPPYATEEVSHG